jgi:cytochrome b involved in lipid metabolism
MKKILMIAAPLFIVGGLYYGYQMMYPKPMPKPMADPTSDPATPKTISMSEIEQHATADSCWMAIQGKVYDVTPFVKSGFHPGKDAILMGCGKDATEIFTNRPNGSGSHSEKAFSGLPKYEIGVLATN